MNYARDLLNWTGIQFSHRRTRAGAPTHSRLTCVLSSFPDLFGESVGTSEALRECLQKRKEDRGKVTTQNVRRHRLNV